MDLSQSLRILNYLIYRVKDQFACGKRESNQWLLRTESIPSGYYLIRASGSEEQKPRDLLNSNLTKMVVK